MAQYGAFKARPAPSRSSPMGAARKGRQALPSRGAGKGRVELYIPIERCGLLIGKGGSMFKELKAAFGVHLSVPRAGDPDGTPTTIEGDPEAVEACFHKVSDAVFSELSVTNAINVNITAAGKGKGRVELYIPIERCGLLIGKGGSMFKELKAAFGVHLSVPRAGDPDGTPTTIEGDPEAVEACFHKVSDAVFSELSVTNATNVNIAAAGAMENPLLLHGADLTPTRAIQPKPTLQQGKGCGHGIKGGVRTASRSTMAHPSLLHGADMTPARVTQPKTTSQQGKSCGHGIKGAGGTASRSSIQEQMRMLERFNHPVLGPLQDASQHAEPFSAVFVSEIPALFNEYALYVLFAPFGPVIEVTMSKANGVGEGVVRFIEPESALAAAEQMHGIQLPGAPSPLVVQLEEGSYDDGLQEAEPQADESHLRVELMVPISRCGLIIGPGGQAFKDLQGKFGVKLQVPSRGDPEGSLTVVEGNISGVEACVEKIQAMVKGECQIVSSA